MAGAATSLEVREVEVFYGTLQVLNRVSLSARGGGFGDFHDPFEIFREVFGQQGGGSIFDDLFGGGARANPGGGSSTCGCP